LLAAPDRPDMGVEDVDCPICGATVRVGLPRESDVERVKDGSRKSTAEDSKVRPLSCPEGHEFSVTFTVG
jgi:hypothetical protein